MRLEEPVASAGWARLLPRHRAAGEDQPDGTPHCVGALSLAEGRAVAVVADDRGRTYTVPLVTDRVGVRRAQPGDGVSESLVALLAEGDRDVDGFRLRVWHRRPAVGERAIEVDQTNESVVVGDGAVVKWAHLVDEGPHPAPTVLSTLDAAGFRGTPRPWGTLEWQGRLLALIVDFVPGAVDGWTWAVADIASLDLPRIAAAGEAMGTLVADFHGALASTARPATPEDVRSWRDGALADLDRALATRPAVLADRADDARRLLGALPASVADVQRVHGDLHVGQVLRAEGYVLTDFDGNPVVPAPERIREQPVAVDVGGLAQSLVHVGLVVRKHRPDLEPHAVDEATAVARSAFLAAYGHMDPDLLRAVSLRQVCREFTYAATHLPRWSYVPEAALPLLLAEVPS